MPLPALEELERTFEKQKRFFELKKGVVEREIERHIQIFEQKRGAFERKLEQKFDAQRKSIEQKLERQKLRIETQIRRFEAKNGIRLDDEVRFIRSWFEKPLAIGAVTPSGKVLARTIASYVDPTATGPIVELGPGTGPVTEALVAQGIELVASGAGGIQFAVLPVAARTLSRGDGRAGRCLRSQAAVVGRVAGTGGCNGVRSSAVYQAGADSVAAPVRGIRVDAPRRTFRPVHLPRGGSHP